MQPVRRFLRMRFFGLALAASTVFLGACAGGDKSNASDTVGVATDTSSAAAAPAPAPASPAPATAPAAGGGTMAPITGATHEVKMIGDAKGYRFEPANITIKAGDARALRRRDPVVPGVRPPVLRGGLPPKALREHHRLPDVVVPGEHPRHQVHGR